MNETTPLSAPKVQMTGAQVVGRVSGDLSKTAKVSNRDYTWPFGLVTTMFFMWALGMNLNDILVPHLKKACDLSDFQSSLIQTCYFGAYFLVSLPAGRIMKQVGYKNGMLIGLGLCACGCLMFYPAARVRQFWCFLVALFVMASGAAFLEVAANPLVIAMGNSDSAEFRINLSQSFNALGAAVASLFGKAFILSGIEHSRAELDSMKPEELTEYRNMEAASVQRPYLFIAVMFLALGTAFLSSELPALDESADAGSSLSSDLRRLWNFPHFVRGVCALCSYVGAQVGTATFIIRYVETVAPGTKEQIAANYLFAHLMLFMTGRIIGTGLMTRFKPVNMLRVYSLTSVALTFVCMFGAGILPIAAVATMGFFSSIQFPTIFALSIKNLGDLTKTGSSVLIMGIVGGAVLPAAMGLVSDYFGMRAAFVIPMLGFANVASYAFMSAGSEFERIDADPVDVP